MDKKEIQAFCLFTFLHFLRRSNPLFFTYYYIHVNDIDIYGCKVCGNIAIYLAYALAILALINLICSKRNEIYIINSELTMSAFP